MSKDTSHDMRVDIRSDGRARLPPSRTSENSGSAGASPSRFQPFILETCTKAVVAFILCVPSVALTLADDATEKKPDPPRVAMCLPLAINVGETTKVIVRGWHLEGVKELRSSNSHITLKVLSTSKAEVPNGLDVKRVGDTQIEVEATVARDTKPSEVELTVIGPDGDSQPHVILVGSEYPVIADKEANDGFRQAQPVAVPQAIDGVIHDKRNVDVFAFDIDDEQRLLIEVHARRHGSALDSLLTLFDERGNIVAVNDDYKRSPDSRIATTLRAGNYFISLQDAHDSGGSTHPFRLVIRPHSATQNE